MRCLLTSYVDTLQLNNASPCVVVANSLTGSGELQYNVRIFFGTGDSPYVGKDVNMGNTTYHPFTNTVHTAKGSTSVSDIELDWFEALPSGFRFLLRFLSPR